MRLSHLSAAAVLVALVAAMFVSLMPAYAAIGDVSGVSGFCVEGAGTDAALNADGDATNGNERADNTYIVHSALPATDANRITIEVPDDGGVDANNDGTLDTGTGRDLDNNPDPIPVTCSRALAGLPVSVAPDVSGTAIVTAKSAALSVSVSDTDNIVAAGGADLTVTLRFSNIVQFSHDATLNSDDNPNNNVAVAAAPIAADAADNSTDGGNGLELLWIRVSGELDNPDPPETGAWDESAKTTTLPIPAGTAAGSYTISAAVRYDPNTNAAVTDDDGDGIAGGTATDDENDGAVLTGSVVITVGDPGMNAASADLSLGTATFDDPRTVKVETVPEDGTEAASSGDIWLNLATLNSLGKAANSPGLTGVTIIAPGAKLAIHAPDSAKGGQPTASAVTGGTGDNSAQITSGVGNTMYVLVSKADRKPGTVDVYAQVVGTDGAPRSNTVTLTFTGPSSSLTLGEPKPVAPGGKTEFTVDASDSAGNAGDVGQLSFKVTDADGNRVSEAKVRVTKDTAGSSTDKDTDDVASQTVGLVETFSTTSPGVYTIETSLAGVKDSEATTTLTVSGTAANVSLETSMNTDAVELGTILTVKATVTDKNGAPVADGTAIAFATGGALTLDKVIAPTTTTGGAAQAEYIVSKGEGLGVIIVTSGSGRATHTVTLPKPEAAAMAEPETLGLHCLSSNQGFATYSCGIDASASEIFGLVSGRGATAVHLWNGSAWVRYSVVDGTEVPGSSDFMVAENDILYISN